MVIAVGYPLEQSLEAPSKSFTGLSFRTKKSASTDTQIPDRVIEKYGIIDVTMDFFVSGTSTQFDVIPMSTEFENEISPNRTNIADNAKLSEVLALAGAWADREDMTDDWLNDVRKGWVRNLDVPNDEEE